MRKGSAVRVHAMKAPISTYSHPGHCMDMSDVPQVEATLYQMRQPPSPIE